MSKKPIKKLAIVDVSSFIFRAFYAIRLLHAPDGTPINAVHGVLNMLLKLFTQYQPTHVLIARDTSGGSFRNELYDLYKANRDEPPDELKPQFKLIENMLGHMQIPTISFEEYEADDIIGAAAVQWEKDFDEIYIVSGDKDLMQFVSKKVKMLDTMKDKVLDPKGVEEKMGVKPSQIVDYLSIVGDASDNIPGMKGIGAKGAATLLKEYKTLENIIAKKDQLKGKRLINAFENHIEDALLSKKLVQIVTDIDLGKTAQETEYRFYPHAELIDFFKDLGFRSTLEKLKNMSLQESEGSEEGEALGMDERKIEFEIVNTIKQLNTLKNALEETPMVAFFPHFTSDQLMENSIAGYSFCFDGMKAFYVPIEIQKSGDMLSEEPEQAPKKEAMKLLTTFSKREDVEIYCYHGKYIFNRLKTCGVELKGRLNDVSQAGHILDQSRKQKLEAIAASYIQMYMSELEKGSDPLHLKGVTFTSDYCSQRVGAIFQLAESFKTRLLEQELDEVFNDLDTPILSILANMEYEGIKINEDFFYELTEKFETELAEIEKKIEDIAGVSINLKSPKQVGGLLFETLGLPVIKKTKTGFSTDSEVLEELDSRGLSEVPSFILKYRELDKLLSTYVRVLPKLKNSKTGRIHTTFNQDVAATGRLSSDNPNLQNIPVRSKNGRLVRKGFIASPGNLLLSADYSQVELRILAHFSKDPTMTKAFQENRDIHAQTAAEVMGKNLKDVTSEDRSKAKAVNFGLMYGQSSFGLGKALRISRAEAKDFITRYFERFSSIKAYLDSLKEDCEKTGYAITMMGRKRFLPDIKSTNRTIKSMAERVAINSPIQGTAADILKKAMIAISDEMTRDGLRSKMLLQVHDELIFEVVEDEIEKMKELVQRNMANAASLSVPLKVDMGIGVNWFDLK